MNERRDLRVLLPGLIAGLTFLVFWPSLHFGFMNWDDAENFVSNLNYRGFDALRLEWMFTTVHKGIYMPLCWLSAALDHALWGMNPQGYHFTNVLWHAVNALLFYAVSLELFSRYAPTKRSPTENQGLYVASACAALFFAVHPLRVESVAWVTERRDVMSGFFALLCVWFYLRERTLGTWTSFAASLLCKPSAVPLPVVLLILDVFPLKRLLGRKRILEKAPYFAVALPMGLVAIAAQRHVGAMTKLSPISLSQKVAVAMYSLAWYPCKTILPVALSPFYRMPSPVEWSSPLFIGGAGAVIIFSWLLYLRRREWPAVSRRGVRTFF